MSIFKNLIGAVLIIAFMAGCAATPITPSQERIQIAMEQAEVACYEQQTDHDIAIMEAMSNVPKDQVAFVVMMMQMSEANKEAMAMATGKSYNPCNSSTSAFDVQVAELKYKNDYASNATGSLLNLGKWAVGGWAVSELMNKASGDAYNYIASGQGKNVIASQNTGSYNTASGKESSVITSSENTHYENKDENCKDCDKAEESEEGEEIVDGVCIGPDGAESPIIREDEDGTQWVSETCSCNSWNAGNCTP